MILIECRICKEQFWVRGYTTGDSWDEPGEIVTELIPSDDSMPLCDCLNDGGEWELLDEEIPQHDDDW